MIFPLSGKVSVLTSTSLIVCRAWISFFSVDLSISSRLELLRCLVCFIDTACPLSTCCPFRSYQYRSEAFSCTYPISPYTKTKNCSSTCSITPSNSRATYCSSFQLQFPSASVLVRQCSWRFLLRSLLAIYALGFAVVLLIWTLGFCC